MAVRWFAFAPCTAMSRVRLGTFELEAAPSVDWSDLAERWTTLRFLLFNFEKLEYAVSQPPSSRDMAAAVGFAMLGTSKSMA